MRHLYDYSTPGDKPNALLRLRKAWGWLFLLTLLASCARMGSPDGGWYDDTPPYVVSSSPADKAINTSARRVNIYFNEFIKLDDAQNKVVISPPQLEMPDIKTGGKRISILLKDSLKENTTYTIDFSDAILDNNESNPMGNYTYSFSTGSQIDTLEVSGYVLNAEDLEPVKGILVGLYANLSDTIFAKEPMLRVSRTDGSGRFVVKGVAPGTYRAYALQDADGDFVYGQKSERLAFSHDTFEPSWKPDTRQDTIWRDSLHIDNILRIPYTHFLPDDVTLLAFTAVQDDRFLLKTERQEPNKLGVYFTYGDSLPPVMRGLNFNADSAFVVEPSLHNDTVYYWLRDTALVNKDTLEIAMQYNMTDTTGLLVSKTDTIEFVPKQSYEKRIKAKAKELEDWQAEQQKKKKNGEDYDSIPPRKFLNLSFSPTGAIDPTTTIRIESETPLATLDTAAIHLYVKVDSLWYDADFRFRPQKGSIRAYELKADWKEDSEYSLEIDSAALADIYGLQSNGVKMGYKVKKISDFSSLAVRLSGIRDTGVVVLLLNGSGNVIMQQRAKNNAVKFNYVAPGKYYLRAYVDANGNNQWDTGDYHADRQPEDVYFYSEEIECKEKWDVSREWNVNARPRFRQKPQALVKTKSEQQRKVQNRNAQRAKELGKEYIQKKTGVRL